MATILRAPVFSSYPGKKAQPAEVWPNLLLSTLAIVVTPPVSSVRIDNPRRVIVAQTDLVQMPMILRLVPAQLLPIGENGYDEWAQSRLKPPAAQDTLTLNVLVRVPAQLLPIGTNGYDEWNQPRLLGRQPDMAGPNALLWDLPPAQKFPVGTNAEDLTPVSKKLAVQADSISNLLVSTLSAPPQIAPPGSIPDWSQWRMRVAHQDTQPTNSLIGLQPPVQGAPPLFSVDLTQKMRPIAAWQDTQTPNLLLRVSIPAQILPVGVNGYDELAQPRLVNRPQDTQVANSLIRISSPGQIAPPIVPVDWVQRRGPVSPQDTQPNNLLTSTLSPIQVGVPFLPIDTTHRLKSIPPQDTAPQNVLIRDLAPQRPPFVAAADIQPRRQVVAQDTQTPQWLLYKARIPASFGSFDTGQSRARVSPQDTNAGNLIAYTASVIVPPAPTATRLIVAYDLQRLTLTYDSVRLSLTEDIQRLTLQ